MTARISVALSNFPYLTRDQPVAVVLSKCKSVQSAWPQSRENGLHRNNNLSPCSKVDFCLLSRCFYDLLRKRSSPISSVSGCSWHLKREVLTELVHVSSRGTVGRHRLRGHCFVILSKAFRLAAPQLNGSNSSGYRKCGLAEGFQTQGYSKGWKQVACDEEGARVAPDPPQRFCNEAACEGP